MSFKSISGGSAVQQQVPVDVTVNAFGRLHFSLVNLSLSGERVNGGAGAMVTPPSLSVSAGPASEFSVSPAEWTGEVMDIYQRLRLIKPVRIDIEFDRRMLFHVGLGFHTQLRLAIGAALCFSFSLRYDPTQLASLLARGGTSGIGALGFWHGGMIFDGGRKRRTAAEQLVPSSAASIHPAAPLLCWRASLPFFPVLVKAKSWELIYGEKERRLFNQFTPVPCREADQCARAVYMDLQSAVVTEDFDAFCSALSELSTIGFKKRELDFRGDAAKVILCSMAKAGLNGAGMSSWGPTFFGFAQSAGLAEQAALELRSHPDIENAWSADFATGATVKFTGEEPALAFSVATRQ
jgi:beta-ribofuranosylaminobenzene 5'-phosphate synthase